MIMHVDAEEATDFLARTSFSAGVSKMEFLSVQRWFLSLEVRSEESFMMPELSERDIKKELIEVISEMQK